MKGGLFVYATRLYCRVHETRVRVHDTPAGYMRHASAYMTATAFPFVSYYFAAARNGTMGSYDDIVCEPRRQPTEMART